MSNARINESDTGRGINWTYGSQSFHSTNGMPGFGDDALRGGIRRFAARHADVVANYKEDRQGAILEEMELIPIAATARAAINAATDEARRVAEADTRFRAPFLTVDPAVAVFHWTRFAAMDRAASARAVEVADLEALTAIAMPGNRAGLDPATFERAVERFRVLNWIQRQQIPAKHPARPSADRIIATGVDMAGAEAEARRDIEAHEARLAQVEASEASARDLIRFLAAVFDARPDIMLNRIMAGA